MIGTFLFGVSTRNSASVRSASAIYHILVKKKSILKTIHLKLSDKNSSGMCFRSSFPLLLEFIESKERIILHELAEVFPQISGSQLMSLRPLCHCKK